MPPPIGVISNWWNELVYRFTQKKDWRQVVDEIHLLQTKRTNENPLFYAAKDNDVCSINKLLKCPSTDIFERGALGETALHVAALFDNLEAAVVLMEASPDLINEPMTSDLYQGETALHIAVVNQNVNLVRELICRGACVTTPRVTGSYFLKKRGNMVYFGEHILSFAACIGNEEIVHLLIEEGANIRAQDCLGNTVLHLLVLQPNKTIACQIYNLILQADRQIEGGIPLEMIQNQRGLTPFKLAAKEGNLVMFQHMINKRCTMQWHFGPLSSCLYDLSEIDSWADDLSILELIVCSKKREARRILELTPVKQLVSLKWNKYGKHYFRFLTFLYLLYIITFTLCCLYRPLKPRTDNATDERDVTIYVQKTLQESYVTYEDHVRLIGEIISVFGALVILLLEIPDIVRVGAKRYFGQTVLGGPFHVIIISYACLVLTILILRLTSTDGEMVIMAVSLVLGWCNVMYFARGFSMLGPYMIMIQKIIFEDLLKFIWLMIVVLFGFATAIWMAYMTQDSTAVSAYKEFSSTFFAMTELFMGLIDVPVNYDIWTPDIVKVLHITFSVFAYLLMINLLIAMMGDTHWRVAQERDELWRAQVVATTIMLERRLPRCMWPRLGNCGQHYGLGDRWYLRVEERHDNSVQKIRRYAKAFQRKGNKAKSEKKETIPDTPIMHPLIRNHLDPHRRSLRGWQIIRRSTMGSDYGELYDKTSEEIYHV
ncbi:transient receptor potential cation channel subfamily V member 6 isoform X1 [Acipenser ruthenus]|uniref:transient receptor potential cation channel subfamily V member 6 isoform X1 n=1 Tax=Acipenser ruthenus TaxID=7906 RepID=UPI00155F57D6|nr:transient receptor potential cation channel subfamily V member 6 isoform X1 [Acipenser ruthenus]